MQCRRHIESHVTHTMGHEPYQQMFRRRGNNKLVGGRRLRTGGEEYIKQQKNCSSLGREGFSLNWGWSRKLRTAESQGNCWEGAVALGEHCQQVVLSGQAWAGQQGKPGIVGR